VALGDDQGVARADGKAIEQSDGEIVGGDDLVGGEGAEEAGNVFHRACHVVEAKDALCSKTSRS